MLDLQGFTTDDLRLMFHACRKYQKTLLGAPIDSPEYYQLNDILTKLQPIAYPEAFDEQHY